MTLKKYQEKALKNLNPSIAKSKKDRLRYCCMGILEETGEIVAELRKPLFSGNYHEKPMDKETIKSEIGDLIWYIALMCQDSKINMDNLININKEENGNEERDILIDKGIKLGQASGKMVKKYLKYKKDEIEKQELEKAIKKQFNNLLKLSNELNITMEEILELNLDKVNKRYNKDEMEL